MVEVLVSSLWAGFSGGASDGSLRLRQGSTRMKSSLVTRGSLAHFPTFRRLFSCGRPVRMRAEWRGDDSPCRPVRRRIPTAGWRGGTNFRAVAGTFGRREAEDRRPGRAERDIGSVGFDRGRLARAISAKRNGPRASRAFLRELSGASRSGSRSRRRFDSRYATTAAAAVRRALSREPFSEETVGSADFLKGPASPSLESPSAT